MFDDQLPTQSGQTPPNLPIGEPEDMFADVDPTPHGTDAEANTSNVETDVQSEATPAASSQVEPSTEPPQPIVETQVATPATPTTAIEAGMLQPISASQAPIAASVEPPPPISSMPEEFTPNADAMSNSVREPNFARKVMILGIILIVSFGIGLLLWLIYTRFFVSEPQVVIPSATLNEQQNPQDSAFVVPISDDFVAPIEEAPTEIVTSSGAMVTTSIDQMEDNTEGTTAEDQILFGDTIDTDEDLLDDDQELQFNTDPRNWDTDGDGLSDGEEVLNWGTDPLSPDTDEDGYDDKDEIDAGYSPTLGGGARLFDTAPATSTNF